MAWQYEKLLYGIHTMIWNNKRMTHVLSYNQHGGMTSTSVRQVARLESDTWIDDINMMMWKHERLPHVIHIWHIHHPIG
jgi:hypothetical protein